MPSWPRISWDAGDMSQLSASLSYLDHNPKKYKSYKFAARLPIMILGAPGGWMFYPNLTFYLAFALLLMLRSEGGIFSTLFILPLLVMVVMFSFAYGNMRDAKLSLIRLQVLKILHTENGPWIGLAVRPAVAYLESLTKFETKPGLIRNYLNKMRSLNRADEFFDRYSSIFMILSLGTSIAFLFFPFVFIALAFVISVLGWVAIIPISFAVSALADVARSNIPKVWHVEDLRVISSEKEPTE